MYEIKDLERKKMDLHTMNWGKRCPRKILF